jgi:hypothetical protein
LTLAAEAPAKKQPNAESSDRSVDPKRRWRTPLGVITIILALEFVAFGTAFTVGAIPRSLAEFVRLLIVGPVIVVIFGGLETLFSRRQKS